MAAHFSEYMSKKILDKVFVDNVTLPTHASMWVALFHNSGGTTEANLRDNTPVNEISGGGYTRVEIVLTGGASFNAAVVDTVGMKVTNKSQINFPVITSAYPGDISHVALFDNSTGGNVIMYSDITTTSVDVGGFVSIGASAFSVNL